MSKEIDDILSVIDKSNPYASFLNESALSNVDGWLDTGSMVLNGIVSGSLFGGIPKNRMTLLAGPSMTGKSFILQKILKYFSLIISDIKFTISSILISCLDFNFSFDSIKYSLERSEYIQASMKISSFL